MTQASLELIYPEEFYEELPPIRGHGTASAGSDALSKELEKARIFIQKKVRAELSATGAIYNVSHLKRTLKSAWRIYRPVWTRNVVPQMLAAYSRGFVQARMGKVPQHILEPLAQQYSEQIGDYFMESSSEALLEGFNAYVNRRLPEKLAAEAALDAFGLTPRQMRGLVASDTGVKEKIASVAPQNLKRRVKSYIGTSLKQRFKVFADEEVYRAEQHAHQLTWLYNSKQGALPSGAKRMWVTADDEKVCPLCGPLHMQKVDIEQPFIMPGSKEKIWTPGLHVNCRCHVQLWTPTLSLVRKDLSGAALADFNDDHPRNRLGRFADKPDAFLGSRTDLATLIESTPVQEEKTLGAPKKLDSPALGKPMSSSMLSAPSKLGAPPKLGAASKLSSPDKLGSPTQALGREVVLTSPQLRLGRTPIRQQIQESRQLSAVERRMEVQRDLTKIKTVSREETKPTPKTAPEVRSLPTPMATIEEQNLRYWSTDEHGNKHVFFDGDTTISDIDLHYTEAFDDQDSLPYGEYHGDDDWNDYDEETSPINVDAKMPDYGRNATFLADEHMEPDDLDTWYKVRKDVQRLTDEEYKGHSIDWGKHTYWMPGIVAGSTGGQDGRREVLLNASQIQDMLSISPNYDDIDEEPRFLYVFSNYDANTSRGVTDEVETYGHGAASIKGRFMVKSTDDTTVKKTGLIFVYLDADPDYDE